MRAPEPKTPASEMLDLADVGGQAVARRALEIAAAGGHNLLLFGPPGAGKTLLARRLPGLLPPLGVEESIEATSLWSIAGRLPPGGGLLRARPFRAPHHTASTAALVGGGTPPRPGEVSLAHHGVLFLDELPEFRREALEALRQPLEEGSIDIVRVRGQASLPCRFQLVAAMNPCPCGRAGDPDPSRCRCSLRARQLYRQRISGPIFDRIDLAVHVPPLPVRDLPGETTPEGSAAVRARVLVAREIQKRRLASLPGVHTNASLSAGILRVHARANDRARTVLAQGIHALGLSARAHDRVLRVARTIADLGGRAEVRPEHVSEALEYRIGEPRWAPSMPGLSPATLAREVAAHLRARNLTRLQPGMGPDCAEQDGPEGREGESGR